MVVGEIKRGIDIGFIGKYNKYVWCKCPSCGHERWIELSKYNSSELKEKQLCKFCNGRKQGKINKRGFTW